MAVFSSEKLQNNVKQYLMKGVKKVIFKSKKNQQKSIENRKNIENMTDEVIKIWNGTGKPTHTDVNGSYTGNPVGFEIPEQDPDDL